MRRKYRKKDGEAVTAVQLKLDLLGFSYRKWGSEQTGRRDDWVVDNGGDVYTVANDSFEETYELVSPGRYCKIATVWAEVAVDAGTVKTQEGQTRYEPGDYLVSNQEDGSDRYAVSKAKFEEMYTPR